MSDFTWLAAEAKTIYLIFSNLFYVMVGFLLVVAVFLEFFKLPTGGVPSFVPLIGRCFVASLMLVSFPEFLNTVGDITDELSKQIGGLNEFKYVLAKMSDQLDKLTWSWTSVKQMTIVAISFLAFFILYISVYVSEAIYFYAWTLLYIFSPICFALYVLPQTESVATGVYKSIIKVASWKVIWAVLATLLWSAALIDLGNLGEETNFLTIILFNLMLAGSLLFTPLVSNMLFSGNFAGGAAKMGAFATGAMMTGASKVMGAQVARKAGSAARGLPRASFNQMRSQIKQAKDNRALNQDPSLKNNPENLPSYQAEKKSEDLAFKKMDQKAMKAKPYLKHMPTSLPSSIKKLEREENKQRLIKRRRNVSNFNQGDKS